MQSSLREERSAARPARYGSQMLEFGTFHNAALRAGTLVTHRMSTAERYNPARGRGNSQGFAEPPLTPHGGVDPASISLGIERVNGPTHGYRHPMVTRRP